MIGATLGILVGLGVGRVVLVSVMVVPLTLTIMGIETGPRDLLADSYPAEDLGAAVAALAIQVGVDRVETRYAPRLGPWHERVTRVELLNELELDEGGDLSESSTAVRLITGAPIPRVVRSGSRVIVLVAEGMTEIEAHLSVVLARDIAEVRDNAARSGRVLALLIGALVWTSLLIGSWWGGVALGVALSQGLLALARHARRNGLAADDLATHAVPQGRALLVMHYLLNAGPVAHQLRATRWSHEESPGRRALSLLAQADPLERLDIDYRLSAASRALGLLRATNPAPGFEAPEPPAGGSRD